MLWRDLAIVLGTALVPACRCGNSMLERGEDCDDGNTRSGDGCTLNCRLELDTCGNRRLDTSESCEDGNRMDGDGCNGECQIEQCGTSRCGNGILELGERCDDGNQVDEDGCSAQCGSIQSNCEPGAPCPSDSCGNGVVDTAKGEACDLGINDGAYGGCTLDCQLAPYCGDGIFQSVFEACDPSAGMTRGYCSPNCDFLTFGPIQ